MKIEMIVGAAGPGVLVYPGDIVDWPSEDEAKRMIARGQAVAVEEKPKPRKTRKKRGE